MGVNHGGGIGVSAEHLGVDRQFRGWGVPAFEVSPAVEIQKADVVGFREGETAFEWPPAPYQQMPAADPRTDVAEDVTNETPMGHDAARARQLGS